MTETSSSPTASTLLRVVVSAVTEAAGREIPLAAGETTLGRSEGNDVVVPDAAMSGRHARITVSESGEVTLFDNNSSNGTIVGGERVEQAALESGQQFTLGKTVFELQVVLPEKEAPPPPPPDPSFERTVQVKDFAELVAQFERPQALQEMGEEVQITANAPFLISDATSVWTVESGVVDVFTVKVEQGKPTGARSHFLSIDEGSAFFGLDADSLDLDSGFLAVGKAGSELRRLPVDRMQLFAPVPEHRDRITKIVQRWVSALSKRLTSDLPSIPDAAITLFAGETTELREEVVIASGNEVVWIEMPPARFLFDGMASLSYDAEGMYFPLAPGSWLELLAAGDTISVEPKSTADVIHDPRLWAGLELFHRVLMECELLNKRLSIVDEFNRLQKKAGNVEEAREAGVGAIEAVLGGTQMFRRPSFGADTGPVFAACALVAEMQDIEVVRPTADLDEMSFEETVNQVAMSSRFRTRRVALVDDWYNFDQGPLLGQIEESEEPVALLPTGPKTYEVVYPQTGDRVKLTPALADELAPFATSFYRRFPDGTIGPRELIRFGMHGLKREFREVLAMGIITGLISTATPAITGKVFDSAIPQADRDLLLQLAGGLFIAALANAAFKITQNVAMMRVQSKMDYSAQAGIWDRMLDLPATFFKRYTAGDLADRAAAVGKIRAIVAGTGVAAILGAFASSFNAVQMLFYSFPLAGVAIALTFVYVGVTTFCNFLKLRLQRQEMMKRGRITGLVLQLITGVAKLRVSGTENHAFRVWATQFADMRRVAFAVGRIDNIMPVWNAGFPVLSSMAIFFTMVTLKKGAAESGVPFELTTGDFLAFNAAYGIFLGAMQALGDASVSLLEIIPVYERLDPILKEEPELDGSKAAPTKLRGSIQLSHISFRYTPDGPLILDDLSLEIEPGDFVAFVGGSGSGKSTLMKVMLGFETPEMGGVYYDGQDLATLDVRQVRQQLGVVLQESRLLPAEIYRNIVGSSSRTLAEAWDAATKAGLADDIKKMPMGMHTYVSEGGGGFSGGQKQRLMIARALVHQPKILYLDEATSALDNKTQAQVTESMDRLQATRIVIAHRLSTIAQANKICYLEKGKIVEMGTYDELVAQDGYFAELARQQES